MKKTKLIFLYVFTFGIAYFVIKAKAKKHATIVNNELTLSYDIPFEINDFYNSVGGKENITSAEANINSIKVFVKDIEKVSQDNIKKLGAKGSMLSENCITCLFGDYSKKLDEVLKMELNSNQN